jgi:hypothetical protein
MTSVSMCVLLLCCLIFINKGLAFTFENSLYEDASNSLDDKQQEGIAKRRLRYNLHNLNSGYSKDNFNVYYMGRKIDGASAMSFQALADGYAKDNWNIYFMGQKISGASKLSFKTLGNGYAKDNWAVYHFGRKMEGVSPNSFSINHFG